MIRIIITFWYEMRLTRTETSAGVELDLRPKRFLLTFYNRRVICKIRKVSPSPVFEACILYPDPHQPLHLSKGGEYNKITCNILAFVVAVCERMYVWVLLMMMRTILRYQPPPLQSDHNEWDWVLMTTTTLTPWALTAWVETEYLVNGGCFPGTQLPLTFNISIRL